MSQAFVHSELPLPYHRFFRLLRLDAPPVDERHVVSCSMDTFELGNCPSYYALSYTWGNPFDRATSNEAYDVMYSIQIDSKSYNVTKNFMRHSCSCGHLMPIAIFVPMLSVSGRQICKNEMSKLESWTSCTKMQPVC